MTRTTFTALALGLIWAAGCDNTKSTPKADPKKMEEPHAHGTGPHGGVVFDLKYHGEFKPDHAKKEATVWILDMDEKTPKRIKADKLHLIVTNTNPKIEIDLLPIDKAADGTASVFVGKHDGFAVEMEYKGTVSVQIDGKPYSDEFSEEPEPKK